MNSSMTTASTNEMLARLDASQKACFDAGQHIAAMDIQDARAYIARLSAPPSARDVREALEWAVARWHAEVRHRPLKNIHRRSLDDTWRQMIRHLGGDDIALCGPKHDDLVNGDAEYKS